MKDNARVTITVKVPPAPPQQIGKQRRKCPTCGEMVKMSITTDGTGWEIWQGSCGHRNDYNVAASPH